MGTAQTCALQCLLLDATVLEDDVAVHVQETWRSEVLDHQLCPTARLHERALGGEETLATLRFFVMFGIHLVQHLIKHVASLVQATVSCWTVFCANPKRVCFCELPRTAGLVSEQAGQLRCSLRILLQVSKRRTHGHVMLQSCDRLLMRQLHALNLCLVHGVNRASLSMVTTTASNSETHAAREPTRC